MSECIKINSLEHLPLEETLLIKYRIICTGTWELLQSATAYRNICDSEWTLMFPNIQQPRHTDFPIVVTPSTLGRELTFAWNYGGIQGISAVNFNESNSYFTQLGVYKVDCTATSGPKVTGRPEPILTPAEPGGGGSPGEPEPGNPNRPEPGQGGPGIPNPKPGQGIPGAKPPQPAGGGVPQVGPQPGGGGGTTGGGKPSTGIPGIGPGGRPAGGGIPGVGPSTGGPGSGGTGGKPTRGGSIRNQPPGRPTGGGIPGVGPGGPITGPGGGGGGKPGQPGGIRNQPPGRPVGGGIPGTGPGGPTTGGGGGGDPKRIGDIPPLPPEIPPGFLIDPPRFPGRGGGGSAEPEPNLPNSEPGEPNSRPGVGNPKIPQTEPQDPGQEPNTYEPAINLPIVNPRPQQTEPQIILPGGSVNVNEPGVLIGVIADQLDLSLSTAGLTSRDITAKISAAALYKEYNDIQLSTRQAVRTAVPVPNVIIPQDYQSIYYDENKRDTTTTPPFVDSVFQKQLNSANPNAIDITSSPSDTIAAIKGALTEKVYDTNKPSYLNTIWDTIEVTRVMPGAFSTLVLPQEEVHLGEPIKISGTFSVSTAAQLRVRLVLVDSNSSYELYKSFIATIKPLNPYLIALSVKSSGYKMGKITLLLVVEDTDGHVVHANSQSFVLTGPLINASPTRTNLVSNGKDLTSYSETPVSEVPVKVNLSDTKQVNLIVVDESANTLPQKITVIAKDNQSKADYSIKVAVNDSNLAGYNSDTSTLSQESLNDLSKIKVLDAVVHKNAHSAAVLDIPIDPSDYSTPESAIVSVIKDSPAPSSADVYVSKNYSMQEASSAYSNSTLNVVVPYAFQRIGLIINGRTKANVPANYVVYKATTNKSGGATFKPISLDPDTHYSIVLLDDSDTTNPYKDVIYRSVYLG